MEILDILVSSLPLAFLFLIIVCYNPITKEKPKKIANVIAVAIFLISIGVSYIETVYVEMKLVYLVIIVIAYTILIRYQVKNSFFK